MNVSQCDTLFHKPRWDSVNSVGWGQLSHDVCPLRRQQFTRKNSLQEHNKMTSCPVSGIEPKSCDDSAYEVETPILYLKDGPTNFHKVIFCQGSRETWAASGLISREDEESPYPWNCSHPELRDPLSSQGVTANIPKVGRFSPIPFVTHARENSCRNF